MSLPFYLQYVWGKPRKILIEMMGDLLHPSRAGHAAMAVCMLEQIKLIINDVPAESSAAPDPLIKDSSTMPSEKESPVILGDSSAAPSVKEDSTLPQPSLSKFVGYNSESRGKICMGIPITTLNNFPAALGAAACQRMCDISADCTAFVYKDTTPAKVCELFDNCRIVDGGMMDIVALKGALPISIRAESAKHGYCSFSVCPSIDAPFDLNSYCHKSRENCEMGCDGVFCYLMPGENS
jgi:hypothetical protein